MVWRDLRLRSLLESPDSFGMTYEIESGRSEEDWHERINQGAADPFGTYLIAELDDEPAGIAACGFDEADRSRCGLYAMWVTPEFRRMGVGRALLNYALEWMKNHGADIAHLNVTEGNDSAFSLYVSVGFEDTGVREPLREASSLQSIVMTRRLDDV